MTIANARQRTARHTAAVALSAFMACFAATAGEIHKWVDQNGEVHYTDTPPPGVQTERVQIEENVIQTGNRPSQSATQPSSPSSAPGGASNLSQKRAELRQQMIEECERNNGTDCAHEVDVQLRAERIEHVPLSGPALAQRRAKMIQDCEDNHGIDCEGQVDTELRAEQLRQDGQIIHNAVPKGR